MQTTDVVKSLSVDNLVNQRAAVIERLGQAVTLIREASAIAAAGHLGMPRLLVSTGFGRGSGERTIADSRIGTRRDGSTWGHDADDRADVDKIIRLGVDAAAWQYLMHDSGLRSLMDASASLTDRLLSKVRLSESGERYAVERLAALGAPRRMPHEGGADYVARLKSEQWLQPVRHPGNLAFTWQL